MIAFVNTFLSYLLLLFIIVAVAGIGVVIGINMRKKKDAQALADQNTEKQNYEQIYNNSLGCGRNTA